MAEQASAKPMWEYTEAVLIGGNHLASALVTLGMDPSAWRSGEYYDVLREFGQPAADIWVAWRAIAEWHSRIPLRARRQFVYDKEVPARLWGCPDCGTGNLWDSLECVNCRLIQPPDRERWERQAPRLEHDASNWEPK